MPRAAFRSRTRLKWLISESLDVKLMSERLAQKEKVMKTLRFLPILAVAVLFAGTARAQEQAPTVEVSAGYTFIHVNVGSGTIITPDLAGVSGARLNGASLSGLAALSGADPTVTSNIHGGSASLAYNFNNWFGMAADFGGSKISSINASGFPSVDVDSTLFTYLFGPRISYRTKTLTPFGQVLFGGAHITDVTSGGVTVARSENAFAMTAGGGLDWNVHKNIAIRVVQVEYLLTRFTDPFSVTGSSGTQNNLRVSAGIVFKLGTK